MVGTFPTHLCLDNAGMWEVLSQRADMRVREEMKSRGTNSSKALSKGWFGPCCH